VDILWAEKENVRRHADAIEKAFFSHLYHYTCRSRSLAVTKRASIVGGSIAAIIAVALGPAGGVNGG
jgi:hypothetical protein